MPEPSHSSLKGEGLPPSTIVEGLIDTHCHLEMEQFGADREDVIRRALDSGLTRMISIASDPASNPAILALAEAHPEIYFSVGLHPHDAKSYDDAFHADMIGWASHPKAVAIGECGLDYHYDHSPRDVQRRVFTAELALAKQLNLPVIIHSREAFEDTMRIVRESGIERGVMHCFSGDVAMAREVLGIGLHISIAGPVTFPKSAALKEVAAFVPDDRLLIETDAPFLTPVPLRGKRNEPAYVAYTARAVAELRGISVQDIARITSLNARLLFGLDGLCETDTIAYRIRDSLYLNLTNRCSNVCSFCARYTTDYVKGHYLKLRREPSADELRAAIGDPAQYKEVVFCGFGEPTIRLDAVIELAGWIKAAGGRVRINTNGQANLIHGRDVLPELAGKVDAISISLDAQDEETYNRLCRPQYPGAWRAVVDFIREAPRYIPNVQATVVTAEGVDVQKCRALADSLGVKLRVRTLDDVG